MVAVRKPKARPGNFLKTSNIRRQGAQKDALNHAIGLVHAVCCLAGPANMLDDLHDSEVNRQLTDALQRYNTAALFDRLINDISYQGISDAAAFDYIQKHGQAHWEEIDQNLAERPSCPKLRSYWALNGCHYQKSSFTCAAPEHIARCPLPQHDLRNGHLNQAAYSLFLFIRDIAGNDLVAWIDGQIETAYEHSSRDGAAFAREALLSALRNVYGVSDKVLGMVLSAILLAAPKAWSRWHEVGGSLIAIDTLVHNFLHRSGILRRF